MRRYEDHAVGIMTKNSRGVPWVSQITLRPRIAWDMPEAPTSEAIAAMHEDAHEQCFIANSIKSRIVLDAASMQVEASSVSHDRL